MMLRFIYTLFLGVFLAIFIGVGIAAFYLGPTYPDMPAILKYCSPEQSQSTQKFFEYKTQAEKFDRLEKQFVKNQQRYSRNVSISAIIGAILILVASLTLFKKIKVLADGLLFGGVLTLIYSVIRGFGTEDNMFRFLVVAIGFLVTLFLGYIKFILPQEEKVAA